MKRRHFINCNVAGFSFYDGAIVFNELKIGTELKLIRETENRFDAYAVAIYYGDFKLGFIPRDMNHELSKFIEMGHSSIFEVRINRLAPAAHTENQVGVIVYLLNKEA